VSVTQADRIEEKLNVLCKAAGLKADLSEPCRRNDRALAEVRSYAAALFRSQVPSERSHGKTLLEILDREH
jgi:hypothetical protein